MVVDTNREYIAPEINVVLVKISTIICTSVADPFNNSDSEEIW